MATVPDLSGNSPIDFSLCKPNRNNAGTPIGSLTPLYSGEIVHDTTNRMLFRAIGITNAAWMPTNDSI